MSTTVGFGSAASVCAKSGMVHRNVRLGNVGVIAAGLVIML